MCSGRRHPYNVRTAENGKELREWNLDDDILCIPVLFVTTAARVLAATIGVDAACDTVKGCRPASTCNQATKLEILPSLRRIWRTRDCDRDTAIRTQSITQGDRG